MAINRKLAIIIDMAVSGVVRPIRRIMLRRTGRSYGLSTTHPALGTVTLGNLMATWVAHDMTHLHQISRILARQYAEGVGPWQRFLGVLHCTGHSEMA